MAAARDPHQGADDRATGAGAVSEYSARGGSDMDEVKTAQEQQGSRKPGGKLDPSVCGERRERKEATGCLHLLNICCIPGM